MNSGNFVLYTLYPTHFPLLAHPQDVQKDSLRTGNIGNLDSGMGGRGGRAGAKLYVQLIQLPLPQRHSLPLLTAGR